MIVKIKSYGPEITRFLSREQYIELSKHSTLRDLFQYLENEIRNEHGWTPELMRSNFSILVNGSRVEFHDNLTLKDGDSISIISPVGGG
jgi:molybdopterin converting factor small subunit